MNFLIFILTPLILIIDCRLELFDNNFTHNSAPNGQGGAVYHDMSLKPPDLQLNKFLMNSAKEYLSYIQYPKSFSLISMHTPVLKVKSGRRLVDSLILGIIDMNNKALQDDSKTIVTIQNYDK